MKNLNFKNMKKSIKIFGTLLMVAILTSAIVLTSCKKKKENPPAIPPQSTMLIDFSGFQQTSKSIDTTSNSNWGQAAFTVGAWNIVISITLAIPVAAFTESFNHEPVQQTDGSWQWTYSVYRGFKIYTAKLNGKVDGNNVTWKMYLTLDNSFTDFLWFTGTSDISATAGQWVLNMSPQSPQPFLQIDWHRNTANNAADIKYLNVIPGGAENGGYIAYTLSTSTPYNATYDIYNKGQNNLTNIAWSTATKEGRIKNPASYSDSNWHCWDSALQNITCQ